MACFHPNMIKVFSGSFGELEYEFLGPCHFEDPHNFGTVADLASKGSYIQLVPCGKCLGCRLDYSREWASRMVIELQDNPDAIFLTLTYRNSDLPFSDRGIPTLCKRDLQLFWKRLRKSFPNKKIRYFVAGEYGPKTHRPHYHAIVYGLSLRDFPDLISRGFNELHQSYFTSPALESIWGKGFVLFSGVTWHTCAYVARYVMKKAYKGDDDYSIFEEPEFVISSRRPGIGMTKAKEMVLSGNCKFSVDGRDGVYDLFLPKAFLKNLRSDPECSSFISNLNINRSIDAHDRLISNLDLLQVHFFDLLDQREKNLLRKYNVLPERGDFNET